MTPPLFSSSEPQIMSKKAEIYRKSKTIVLPIVKVDSLPEEVRSNIEADSFWCMTRVLDGIQDNYTFAQPGIQVSQSTHSTIKARVVPYIYVTYRTYDVAVGTLT